MDDKIIDLQGYVRRRREGGSGVFAVWGTEGERSRFALPVWRAIFLLKGGRGGIVWMPAQGAAEPSPFFLLDLRVDPARLAFPQELLDPLLDVEAPALGAGRGGGIAVLLGREEGRAWFLAVDGRADDSGPEGKTREDLLFLAGECAGLLFLRELAHDEEG